MNTPWHLWVIGIATLLFFAGGAWNYIALQYELEALAGMMSAEQLAWFDAYPLWAHVAWAVSVWSAVAGSLFLLMRSMWAGVAFGFSLIAYLIASLWSFVLAQPQMTEIAGKNAIWFSLVIFVVILGSWLYARQMRKEGVLE